jgi:mRNA interferase RelE/StbE
MYHLVFTKKAEKFMRRLPRNEAKRIREKLILLANDPYAANNNVTAMQNRPGYRLRIGDWRVIYTIQDEELIILVLKVGSRGDIYR